MIEIKKMNFSYGDKSVIEDINIRLNSGTIYCLVGENGAGKTTMIESILKLNTSKVFSYFDGKKIESVKEKMGIVFQENGLQPRLKVKEELDAYVDLFKVKEEWKKEVIEEFKLSNIIDKYTTKLSGGERRRVLLALAFINKPKYVILDEPFTGIDTNLRYEFRKFINRYAKEYEATILFSEHNLFECKKHDYHFLFLYNKKIQLQGSAEEIFNKLGIEESSNIDIQDVYIDLWKGKYNEKISYK